MSEGRRSLRGSHDDRRRRRSVGTRREYEGRRIVRVVWEQEEYEGRRSVAAGEA